MLCGYILQVRSLSKIWAKNTTMSGRSFRKNNGSAQNVNIASAPAKRKEKDKDKDKSELYDLEGFQHANLEEKIDLMIATMPKVHKSFEDKFSALHKEVMADEKDMTAKLCQLEEKIDKIPIPDSCTNICSSGGPS